MELIILGTTIYSATTRKILEKEGVKVVAYSTYRDYIKENEFEGLPVYPFEDLNLIFGAGKFMVINTIGYSNMNRIREKVYYDIKRNEYQIYTFISKYAQVYTDDIGEGSLIMPNAYIGPYVKLGACCVVNPGTQLSHHISMGNFNFIGRGVIVGGDVEICNNCFIGLHSTIKNKIKISDYTIVGAGSNVIKSTEENCVYVGNPAKKLEGKESLNTKI